MTADRAQVLFIAGAMRSGTTLLGDLLGQVPGLVHIGELAFLWDHGFRHDFLCGCGVPFSQCELWTRVVRASFDDPSRIDVDRMDSLARRFGRATSMLLLASENGRERVREAMREHTAAMARVYRSILDATGARMVVDSSKRPMFAWLAAQHPAIDLRVVYMARDPRAVAYSRQRPKYNPDKQRNMGGGGPLSTSVAWLSRSSFAAALWDRPGGQVPFYRLRYEDLAAAPRPVLDGVTAWLGMDGGSAGVIAEDGSYLATPHHAIAGNPARFKRGRVQIRLDAEWQERSSSWNNLLVSTLTWPMLARQGYPLRPTART